MESKIEKIKSYLTTINTEYDIISEDLVDIVHDLIVNHKIPEIKDDTDSLLILYLSYYYYNDDTNKLKYLLMAVEKNNVSAMSYLGYYYGEKKDFDNMIKYYLIGVNFGCAICMNNIAYYYSDHNDYTNTVKYYLMAIKNGSHYAIYNLALYYEKEKDYDNMLKYYLIAIDEANDTDAMNNLALYYEEVKDYDNMIKYYDMAIKNKDTSALKKLYKYYNLCEQRQIGFYKFIDLYDNGIDDAQKYIHKFICSNNKLFKHYLDSNKQIKIQLTDKINEATKMAEYIEELEHLPDGPAYIETKKHFESLTC
jgi:TPR repeat protein